MAEFDKESILKPLGNFFSEKDRFILSTLFAPFEYKVQYIDSLPQRFECDLAEVSELIRKPLDCFNIQPAVYAKAGSQFEAFAKKLLVQFFI